MVRQISPLHHIYLPNPTLVTEPAKAAGMICISFPGASGGKIQISMSQRGQVVRGKSESMKSF